MAIGVMHAVFNTKLPPKLKYLLLVLADFADEYGRNVFPSIALLAQRTSYSERSVQRLMEELRSRSILVVDPRQNHAYGKTTAYRIVLAGLTPPPPIATDTCPRRLRQECIDV